VQKRLNRVNCHRCHDRVPVSSKIVRIEQEALSDGNAEVRSFVARCRLCGEESIYQISELQTFEGHPRPRIFGAHGRMGREPEPGHEDRFHW
jgi:RNase P subunit RPR2